MTDRHRPGLSSATVVLEAEVDEDLDGSVSQDRSDDRGREDLYPVALLKIAMAMKRLDQAQSMQFEELLDRVLDGMIVDRDDFARYVQRNMSRLVTDVRERDY